MQPDVAVTVVWVVLLGLGVVWEVVCHRSRGRWTGIGAIGARLWVHLPGRILLIAVWAFVGWHVFARYTVPV